MLSYGSDSPLMPCRLYYGGDPSRLATCPITIHSLLHIADSIAAAGPVWCSWAFPMERFCGLLQRAVKGRRFVWASIYNAVLIWAQLSHAQNQYNLFGVKSISLSPPPMSGGVRIDGCESTSCLYSMASANPCARRSSTHPPGKDNL
jgi:hypothetical protein